MKKITFPIGIILIVLIFIGVTVTMWISCRGSDTNQSALHHQVITYERTGGFAGFCDRLLVDFVKDELQVQYIDSCTNESVRVDLSSEQKNLIGSYFNTYQNFEWKESTQGKVSDGMSETLIFYGVGNEVASEEQKEVLLRTIRDLVSEGF